MSDLLDCPTSPNCISSVHGNPNRRVEPLTPRGVDPMARLAVVVHSFPRSQVEVLLPHLLHATFRSRLFGFVDDFIAVFDPKTNRIDVRMAARTGWWDLGVNGRRMTSMRERYEKSGDD